MVLLAGTAHPELAAGVADCLHTNLGRLKVARFADGELDVWLEERVSGEDVVVIQPTTPPVNDHLLEICLIADAARRAGAKSITAVIPYFGYARKERQSRLGEAIAAKVVVDLLTTSGVSKIITCDLHAPAVVGFSTIPFSALTALSILAEKLRPFVLADTIVMAPDAGGVKRARNLGQLLGLPVGFIEKRRDAAAPDQLEVLSLNGVSGQKRAIIIDDLISTGATIMQATTFLKEQGVAEVIVVATHGVFSQNALANLQQSAIDKLLITDTVPFSQDGISSKVSVLSIASLLADAIAH